MKLIILFFILFSVPTFAANIKDAAFTSNGTKALETFGHAYIKYNKFDKKLKELEKKYINKEFKKYGAWVYWTAKVYKEKQVKYEWKF